MRRLLAIVLLLGTAAADYLDDGCPAPYATKKKGATCPYASTDPDKCFFFSDANKLATVAREMCQQVVTLRSQVATQAAQIQALGGGISTPLPPACVLVSPTSGAEGTSVTISGAYFSGAASVTFGGTGAAYSVSGGGTSITTTVPPGALSGSIVVTTGVAPPAVCPGSFTVDATAAAPTILDFRATPSTIISGSTSTLSWSVSGASAISINQGVGTVVGTGRSVAPTTTTTYTLTASNSVGSATATAIVTVFSSCTVVGMFASNLGVPAGSTPVALTPATVTDDPAGCSSVSYAMAPGYEAGCGSVSTTSGSPLYTPPASVAATTTCLARATSTVAGSTCSGRTPCSADYRITVSPAAQAGHSVTSVALGDLPVSGSLYPTSPAVQVPITSLLPVTATRTDLTWSVGPDCRDAASCDPAVNTSGVIGGSASYGTISTDGTYQPTVTGVFSVWARSKDPACVVAVSGDCWDVAFITISSAAPPVTTQPSLDFTPACRQLSGVSAQQTIPNFTTTSTNRICFVTIDSAVGVGITTGVAGGGLTWTRIPGAPVIGGNSVADAYWAWVASGSTISGVTYTPGTSTDLFECVACYKDSQNAIGPSRASYNNTGTGSTTVEISASPGLTPPTAYSLIIGTGTSTSGATARTFGANDALVATGTHWEDAADGDTFWVEKRIGATNAGTAYPLSTLQSEAYWAMLGWVILPGTSSGSVSISCSATTVPISGSTTCTASGGTTPYVWSMAARGSGTGSGVVASGSNHETGTYYAGAATAGGTDIVRVCDSAATPVCATQTIVVVAASACNYFVTTGGSGSTCSEGSPCGSITTGIGKLSAGQTLCVAPGDYNQSITINGLKGTPNAGRITIQGYGGTPRIYGVSGEGAILAITDAPASVPISTSGASITDRDQTCYLGRCSTTVSQFLTFKNLFFDASVGHPGNAAVRIENATGGYGAGAHHIRFDTVEVSGSTTQGFAVGGDYHEFLNCKVHDNGTTNSPATHGYYFGHTRKALIQGGKIYNNHNEGVHQWCGAEDGGDGDCSDNVYDGVELYANGNAGDTVTSTGLGLGTGARTIVRNVIAHDHPYGPGILVHSGAVLTSITGSTVYNNANSSSDRGGINIGQQWGWGAPGSHAPYAAEDPDVGGHAYFSGADRTSVTGSVLYGNRAASPAREPTGQIQDDGTNSSFSGNTTGAAATNTVSYSTGYYTTAYPGCSYSGGCPVSGIDWAAYTHVVNFTTSAASPAAIGNEASLISAAHSHGVKVLLGIGSASSCAFPTSSQSTWANTVAGIVNTYGYDGVDVDWEFWFCGSAPTSTQFCSLLSALRTALGSSKAITLYASMDAASTYNGSCTGGSTVSFVDQWNVDTYEVATTRTGTYALSNQVATMTGIGIPKSKIGILLGISNGDTSADGDLQVADCPGSASVPDKPAWARTNGVSFGTWGMQTSAASRACEADMEPLVPAH